MKHRPTPDLTDAGPYATSEDGALATLARTTVEALRRDRYEDDLRSWAADNATRARVNVHVSNLFFNHDLSGAHRTKDGSGDFDGYDDGKLHEEAAFVLRCLDKLGVRDLPDTEQLVSDFYSRL